MERRTRRSLIGRIVTAIVANVHRNVKIVVKRSRNARSDLRSVAV